MLKVRLVGCLIVKGGIVVQSVHFQTYLPVGKAEIAAEFLNGWGIDEIVVLDIDATPEGRPPDFTHVERIAQKCFVPLTVGGGIRTIEDIRRAIHSGADKVCINTAAVSDPALISRGASVFGNQCIIASMDVAGSGQDAYEVYTACGRQPTGMNPVDYAKRLEELGAGEILLTSMERDGSKTGFDLNLIASVSNAVGIPVIACGGAGHVEHFRDCINVGGVSAVAAGNYFHFTEHSATIVKAFMQKDDIDMRLDTYATYENSEIGPDGRIEKKHDDVLEQLRFEHYPAEVI